VRDWEQGAHRPDKAAQVLLTVIANDPDAVARALEGSQA
jgi:putative transcriptional regulator